MNYFIRNWLEHYLATGIQSWVRNLMRSVCKLGKELYELFYMELIGTLPTGI